MPSNSDMLTLFMKLPYAARISIDECGGRPCFVAINPELYGCMAQGNTPREAVDNLKEARRDYIATLLQLGREVPRPAGTPQSEIHSSSSATIDVRLGVGDSSTSHLHYSVPSYRTVPSGQNTHTLTMCR